MQKFFFFIAVIMLLSLTILFAAACIPRISENDDDDDDNDDNDNDTVEEKSLHGCVLDFQTRQGVLGATVTILNNDTGAETKIKGTTDGADGCFSLDGIDGSIEYVGLKITADDCVDSFHYHIKNGAENEDFLLLGNQSKVLFELCIERTIDPDKAMIAGGLFWGDSNEKNPTGCQQVSFNPGQGEVFYFGLDDLPLLSRDFPGDPTGTAADNGHGTNPANGLFIIVNESPGPVIAFATVNGKTKTVLTPDARPNSISFADIHFTSADFPLKDATPDWCTE